MKPRILQGKSLRETIAAGEVGACPHGWCGFVEFGLVRTLLRMEAYESLGKEFGLYRA